MLHVNVVLEVEGSVGVLYEMVVDSDDVLRSLKEIAAENVLDVWESFHQGELRQYGRCRGGGSKAYITFGSLCLGEIVRFRVSRELIL